MKRRIFGLVVVASFGPWVGCDDDSKQVSPADGRAADAARLDAGVDGPVADSAAADGTIADLASDAGTDAAVADASGRSCAVERFDNIGDQTVAQLDLANLTITASGQIHVLANGGLGVDDHMVDDDEWLRFTFDQAQYGISYNLRGASGPTGSVGTTTVEAFDASNASLGTQQVTAGGRFVDVSGQFGNVPILAFKLQPVANAGIRVGSLGVHCCRREEALAQLSAQTTAQLQLTEVTVTGAADVKVTSGVGLGVVGGDDGLLDGSEWLRFAFALPAIRVSYRAKSLTDEYVNVDLETFDEGGTSTGTRSSEFNEGDRITLRDARYDKIGAFTASADGTGTGHAIESLEYWADCI